MPRVKRGTIKNKTRKYTLSKTKGYRFGRKSKKSLANEAIVHAGKHAFAHRKDKKNDFRQLWNVRINAIARTHGMSYSKMIGALKKNNITLDRKVLSELAQKHPKAFEAVIAKLK